MKQLRLIESESGEVFDSKALQSRRVPLERKVILKFHHFGGFFIEYSANISSTGMFIKTEAPKPPGSVFIFEIWLGDEFKLVHGLGEVVWVRNGDSGHDRPAGMGIRFLKIDRESREVVERIIAEHVQKGGEVFDLSAVAPAEESEEDDSGAVETAAEGDAAFEPLSPTPFEGPVSDRDLLSLDEEVLGLAAEADEAVSEDDTRPLTPRRKPPATRSRLRIALLLAALAALLGGAAYLYSAGLVPF